MKLTILDRPTTLTSKDFKLKLEQALIEVKGDLSGSLTLAGFSPHGWAEINITGEDHEILTQLISRSFGPAVTTIQQIEFPGTYEASIIGPDPRGLRFDIGLGSERYEWIIPTGNLSAQLADGKSTPLRQLMECYCLYSGSRASVRIMGPVGDALDAWLSDECVDRLASWINSGLDRVQIFDCYREEAESAVAKLHLSRDVISVESLTLTLQSAICKLGTDAIGLIPELGHILRKQRLRPFQPRKIRKICRPW